MSDSRAAAGPETFVLIQPRELKEAIFRALCSVGADPLEAQEGALAVLRAEAYEHVGLHLAPQLLEPAWASSQLPPRVASIERAGTRVKELSCPGQPALRTMIELVELACDGLDERISIAYTAGPCLPGQLWNEILLRQSARLQRRMVMVNVEAAPGSEIGIQTAVRRVDTGAVTVEASLSSAIAAIVPAELLTPGVTLIAILEDPIQTGTAMEPVPPKPLKVREEEWMKITLSARKFLVPDS